MADTWRELEALASTQDEPDSGKGETPAGT
jgi:hypothetical protein